MKQSAKYKLNWHDILKGLLIGAGTGMAMFIQESLKEKDFVFHWQDVAMAGVGGIATYLLKNWFSGNKPE